MQLEKFLYKHNKLFIIILDLLLISSSFIIWAWIKPDTIRLILPQYTGPFIILAVIWLVISYLLGKYDISNIKEPIHLFIAISSITFLVMSIVTILLFALKLNAFSRLIVFGTITLCYIFELMAFRAIYDWLKICNLKYDKRQNHAVQFNKKSTVPIIRNEFHENKKIKPTGDTVRKKLIDREAGLGLYDFISEFLDIESESCILLDTASQFNIENIQSNNNHAIVNLKKVNNLKQINQFFEHINAKLSDAGIYIGCMETLKQRNSRIIKNKSPLLKPLVIGLDFIANQALHVTHWSRNVIFKIPGGLRHFYAKAEVLGRLVSCGFEIIEYKAINNLTYFVVLKVGEPSFVEEQSYDLLFKMPRIGKDGQIIHVYKFRTMHPYSEYLQDYVIRLNGYSELGKPADDFRLTKWGRFMRKYWLDEIPQLVNVLRGEMNLFGTRPLSRKAFDDYPDDVRTMRIKYKPGCIPPYVALLKQGMSQSIEAERIYLLEKEKSSFATDFKYIKMALFNIITNKIRSA